MISIKREKDSTVERLIGFVDKTEVISMERSVFEPYWKVLHHSNLPNGLARVKEYTKCMSDIVFAAECSRL